MYVSAHDEDEVAESKTWKELKALLGFIVFVTLVFLIYLIGHMMKLALNVYLIVESFQGFDYYPYVLEDYMLLMGRNVRVHPLFVLVSGNLPMTPDDDCLSHRIPQLPLCL